MDFSKLFDSTYLFDPRPGSEFQFMVVMIIVFLALVMGSFYLEKWIDKHALRKSIKQVLPNTSKTIRNLGLVGFVLLFIRHQNLPYVSMRAILIGFLILILAYVGYTLHRFRTQLPQAIEAQKKAQKKKAYLPKSRKKSRKKRKKRK